MEREQDEGSSGVSATLRRKAGTLSRSQASALSLSGVIRKSRTRRLVALKIVLATAAAVPTIPISPGPLTPSGLTYRLSHRRNHLGVGDVGMSCQDGPPCASFEFGCELAPLHVPIAAR